MGRGARFWEVLGLRLKAPGDRSPTCAVHTLIVGQVFSECAAVPS